MAPRSLVAGQDVLPELARDGPQRPLDPLQLVVLLLEPLVLAVELAPALDQHTLRVAQSSLFSLSNAPLSSSSASRSANSRPRTLR